jgi:cytochrome c oxidase subunit 3
MAQASIPSGRAEQPPAPILFGTILFLASELLFFGGLFAAYFTLRSETSPWPPAGVELDTRLAAVATALLIVSSGTLHLGLRAGATGSRQTMRRCVIVTIVLGVGFLAIQIRDYRTVDFHVSTHAYGTMYYAMTGLHWLHVAAGVVLLTVIVGRMAQGAYREGRLEGAHAIAYYWHFVDVVWIALFSTLFLLR